ncbi:hypothetical protein A8924_7159 [Saccharopolyspora erythraea NRRL 2338]|uniref:DUF2157 domain-containing protein n=2 Tax=Saccharopolyspora erythraea TaxID=1836 RepID=A4FPI9_SACEN|nr:DUF2157 domain-containing protein [Saccharopolyspora erythraea]EQD85848.1 hypothetical protein N599_12705 [Saccharopolyspora erythraea D]PFG99609.1 hypothetical protein A8924_7159 [Saccharopolyspora erythraea NRRL 2338]QRK89499.1 hypothetical protein JQX30_34030 [Saccharopolyspora erythraea]CAM05964.1 hypothetical protein SACE_6800 [Saccharopolyspora erythraea NRRL 2338]
MNETHRLSPEQRARLERLADRGVLTREQVAAVLEELDSPRAAPESTGSGLWEVLGYIGGALVLGGASLLVGMSWEDLTRPARVGLLVAATLALAAAGLVIAGGPRGARAFAAQPASPRGRIVGVLFALGACTAALAVGSGVDAYESLAATATGLLVALLGYAVVRGLPLLVVAVGFSVGVVVSAGEEWFSESTPLMTTALVALGAVWTALAATGALRHRQTALGAGVVIALAGSQYPLTSEQPWWGYGLTLLIALGCFAAYLAERAAVLLVLGVVGVTVSVPEAVWDWTGGALSGPLVVLLVGVVFLAAGGIGLRLRRNPPPLKS